MALIDTQQANRLRDIPLIEVAARLGLNGRREGRSTRYKSDKFNIVVTGQEFFDNDQHYGSYGAISLVMHVLDLEYRQAIAWLSGQQHAISATRSTPPLFPITKTPAPAPRTFAELFTEFADQSESSWTAARNYLVRRRQLPAPLVDDLHGQGVIYANSHIPNCAVVFLHRDFNNNVKGFTLRSTYDPADGKKFCPCMGDKEGAWFYLGDLNSAAAVVLTESPIDALSYAVQYPQADTAVVSLAGWFLPDALFSFLRDSQKKVVVALDNDPKGIFGWWHIQVRFLFLIAERLGLSVEFDSGCDDLVMFRLFIGKGVFSSGCQYQDVIKLLGVAQNRKLPVQVILPEDFVLLSRRVPHGKDWNFDLQQRLGACSVNGSLST